MEYTTNLNLKKPDVNEHYNIVEQENANMDLIDEAVSGLNAKVGSETLTTTAQDHSGAINELNKKNTYILINTNEKKKDNVLNLAVSSFANSGENYLHIHIDDTIYGNIYSAIEVEYKGVDTIAYRGKNAIKGYCALSNGNYIPYNYRLLGSSNVYYKKTGDFVSDVYLPCVYYGTTYFEVRFSYAGSNFSDIDIVNLYENGLITAEIVSSYDDATQVLCN